MTQTAPKTITCDCPAKRDVYLVPALDPNFVSGRCSSCKKLHSYAADKVPVREKFQPVKRERPSEAPIPTNDINLDLSLDNDCVRLRWNGKTFTIGKIRGREFEKFENGKGVHVATDSFGMPWALMKFLQAKGVEYIRIFYGGYWYATTVDNFIDKGFFLYFKGTAEKRIYLKRSNFN